MDWRLRPPWLGRWRRIIDPVLISLALPMDSFLNNNARLGADGSVMKLEDYANMQAANYMLTPFKQAVSGAANELSLSESQVVRGWGGHGGDVDVWSMLSVDKTQARDGDKRAHQPRLFATTPALKAGRYNADAASNLMHPPHTRISRAGGDITEVQPREIGLMTEADSARLAGLGNAVAVHGSFGRIGESTRGSYE